MKTIVALRAYGHLRRETRFGTTGRGELAAGWRSTVRCGMAMMLSKTYEALKAAGTPDDKARDAAEEIAGYDNRLVKIEADLTLLKWMLGLNLAFSLTLIVKTFFG